MLQKRLEKLNSVRETLPQHDEKLNTIAGLVDSASITLPAHYKESMTKDLANVK